MIGEPRLSKLRVLVIDDQHNMRKVIRTMLAALGIGNVFEATNGAHGLDLISETKPHVIVLDWDMPLLNGLEFMRLVRRPDYEHSDIPIIMITGHAERWRVLEAARLGVHEFLLKPVSTHALRDRIFSILNTPRPMVRLQDTLLPSPRRTVVIDTYAR